MAEEEYDTGLPGMDVPVIRIRKSSDVPSIGEAKELAGAPVASFDHMTDLEESDDTEKHSEAEDVFEEIRSQSPTLFVPGAPSNPDLADETTAGNEDEPTTPVNPEDPETTPTEEKPPRPPPAAAAVVRSRSPSPSGRLPKASPIKPPPPRSRSPSPNRPPLPRSVKTTPARPPPPKTQSIENKTPTEGSTEVDSENEVDDDDVVQIQYTTYEDEPYEDEELEPSFIEKKYSKNKLETTPIERPRSTTPINLATLDDYVGSTGNDKQEEPEKMKINIPGLKHHHHKHKPKSPKPGRKNEVDDAVGGGNLFSEGQLFSHSASTVVDDDGGQQKVVLVAKPKPSRPPPPSRPPAPKMKPPRPAPPKAVPKNWENFESQSGPPPRPSGPPTMKQQEQQDPFGARTGKYNWHSPGSRSID